MEIIRKQYLLAGYEAAIDLKESHWQGMDDVKAALQANLDAIGNKAQPVRFIGAWEADPGADYRKKKNHSRRLYFYGVEVTRLDGVPAGCVTKEFPESAFAVFKERAHGSVKYDQLDGTGYGPDGGFQEKYAIDLEIFDAIGTDGPEWDFVVPILKREEASN